MTKRIIVIEDSMTFCERICNMSNFRNTII